MKPLLVVVTGPDGVGKSTAVGEVATRLGDDATVARIWDALQALLSKTDARAHLADLGHVARSYLLLHGVARSLELARRTGKRVILVDGYWYKYAVSEVELGAPPAVFASCPAIFPRPDLVFHLDLPVAEALRRKGDQSDYERGFGAGDEAFLAFQARLRDRWATLAAQVGPWRTLDASRSEAEIVAEILVGVRELA